MLTRQRAVPAGNVTVPQPPVDVLGALHCDVNGIILTPNPLLQVMLLRAAAGGWGWTAGGGAGPVAQLDPGAHICPWLPIPEQPLETQPWPAFTLDAQLAFSHG